MKILFLIPKLSYTGAPKMMSWVANKMVDRGNEIVFLSMYKSEKGQILNDKIKYRESKIIQASTWFKRNIIDIFSVIKYIRKQVKEFKPDVIVSFLDSISYIYIFLNKFFWHDKILVSERVDPYSRKGIKSKIHFFALKLGDYIIFQTEQAQHFFGEKILKKSSVIYNPVVVNDSINKINKNRKKLRKSLKKEIALVGRLSLKQKRQDVAIRAMKRLNKFYPEYKLNIFGSGPDEEIIRKIISENHLENVVFLKGQKQNVLEIISDYTCFILSSDFEGIPNALIEAMSIGLPCVSTDCSPGGAKILIKNGRNGFIVEKGNDEELFIRIKEIIDNPKTASEMGTNAMKISEDFSEEKISYLWMEAFEFVKNK